MTLGEILLVVFTAITAIGVIFGVLYARYQIKEANHMRKLQTFNTLLAFWGGKEERVARRYVEEKFPKGQIEISGLDEEERENLEACLACFNRIAFLTRKGLVLIDDAVDYFGYRAMRCWDKVETYVEKRREEDQGYLGSFKWFVDYCKQISKGNY